MTMKMRIILGRSAGNKKNFSEQTTRQIDEKKNYSNEKAGTILAKNMDKLHNMADALLRFETIDQDQISDIMAGAIPRDKTVVTII